MDDTIIRRGWCLGSLAAMKVAHNARNQIGRKFHLLRGAHYVLDDLFAKLWVVLRHF